MPGEQINQPSQDERQEVLSSASQRLEAMREKIDGEQRERVLQLIRNENLSSTSLEAIDLFLDRAQQEYARNPTKSIEILNAMIAAGEDGEISRAEVLKAVGAAPGAPGMEKIGGMVEKMSSMMNGLGEQLGGLGSGTLKMLEGFFGPDSLFGKVFAMLKNTPKAQVAYIEKKLLEQQKTLAADTDPQQIVNTMKSQIIRGLNIERRAKRTPTYDIVQHVEQIMAEIDPAKTELKLEDFTAAGEKVLAAYETEVAALPPPAPEAAAATERVKKPATPSAESPVASNDATPITVLKEADGVKFTMLGKSATLKKVGEVSVTSAEILAATPTLPATVALTLSDNTKIEVSAVELKGCATDTNKKTLVAKNVTNNSDITLEIQFA